MDILDVFSDVNVRDYYREFPTEPMLGQIFFPNSEKIAELTIGYIVGAERHPVIANIHAMDSETEIGERDGLTTKTLELLKIARKLQLRESEIRKLNQPRTNAEQQYVANVLYDDVTNMRNAVANRIELMRMQALVFGKLRIDGNGIAEGIVDYLVPPENKYTSHTALPGQLPWSDPEAKILDDIYIMSEALARRGGREVKRALTSRKILAYMLRNKTIRAAFFGVNSDMLLTIPQLNNLLASQGLPQVATDDRYYRVALKKSQEFEEKRFFPENKFVMMPEVALGETIFGVTAEEIEKMADVQYSETENILTMVYKTGPDPIGVWTKSCAIAIPTFPEAGNVIQATVMPAV